MRQFSGLGELEGGETPDVCASVCSQSRYMPGRICPELVSDHALNIYIRWRFTFGPALVHLVQTASEHLTHTTPNLSQSPPENTRTHKQTHTHRHTHSYSAAG